VQPNEGARLACNFQQSDLQKCVFVSIDATFPFNLSTKVTKVTDVQSQQQTGADQAQRSLRSSANSSRRQTCDQSPRDKREVGLRSGRNFKLHGAETSGSDDAFLSDSDDCSISTPSNRKTSLPSSGSSKKKRRAPLPPKVRFSSFQSRAPFISMQKNQGVFFY